MVEKKPADLSVHRHAPQKARCVSSESFDHFLKLLAKDVAEEQPRPDSAKLRAFALDPESLDPQEQVRIAQQVVEDKTGISQDTVAAFKQHELYVRNAKGPC